LDLFAGNWSDKLQAEFAIAQNDPGNPEHASLWSRFDYHWDDDTAYFCHTTESAASADEAYAHNPYCQQDNANTTTFDESTNCYLYADNRDLASGCNGSAWRKMEGSGIGQGFPTGDWVEIMHEDKLPVSFIPPTGSSKVEVVGVISGHGFAADTENCAEFCDHQHRFTANGGTAHTKTHPEAGTAMGCAEQVGIGTVPNQSGTWVYGRAGWCPGLEVPVWRADITDDINPGIENELEYIGLFDGDIYHPKYTTGTFWPQIRMDAYIVYYD
jgi:hypothetical protein